jgi:hypothetical protein
MVYLWIGQSEKVLAHTDKEEGKLLFGIKTEPVMAIMDEQWEEAGNLARVMDGKIFLGKTDAEKAAEERVATIADLKKKLADSDYVVLKIAEGAATHEEYAAKIAERQAWRKKVEKLETTAKTT